MKQYKAGCNLGTCMMCRLSLKEWTPAIGAHRKNIQYDKGELLFREDDAMAGIYFVYSGLVKVHKRWDADKDLIVRFAGKGDIVGHRGLGGDNFFPVSATALEPCVICFIDIDFFLTTLKVNSHFLFELLFFYAEELKESERNMRNLAHMPVKGRIAQALLTLHQKFGNDNDGFINLNISRQDLASYAGTTYETFFRLINELIADNAISTSGKRIAIRNPVLLEQLSKAGA